VETSPEEEKSLGLVFLSVGESPMRFENPLYENSLSESFSYFPSTKWTDDSCFEFLFCTDTCISSLMCIHFLPLLLPNKWY